MVQTHQPGEAVFRSVLSEESGWKPFGEYPFGFWIVNEKGTDCYRRGRR